MHRFYYESENLLITNQLYSFLGKITATGVKMIMFRTFRKHMRSDLYELICRYIKTLRRHCLKRLKTLVKIG